MKLVDYMELGIISPKEFAKLLGIPLTQLYQYMYGKVKPREKIMMEICILTGGLVTANDFYGTTSEKVQQEMLRRIKNGTIKKWGNQCKQF